MASKTGTTKSSPPKHPKKESILTLNTRIYPIDALLATAYSFLDRAHIVLDGNPEKNITVTIRPKDRRKNASRLAQDFADEITTYAAYKTVAEKNAAVKDAIIHRVLATNQKTPPKKGSRPSTKK